MHTKELLKCFSVPEIMPLNVPFHRIMLPTRTHTSLNWIGSRDPIQGSGYARLYTNNPAQPDHIMTERENRSGYAKLTYPHTRLATKYTYWIIIKAGATAALSQAH